jgi:Spy/CpxP family protein refolding chaperone
MNNSMKWLTSVSAFLIVAAAMAQGGPGGPGGFEGGPQGGRGRGPGMEGGRRGPGGPGGVGLILAPSVQKELNLTSAQIESIKKLIGTGRRGPGGPGGPGGQGGPGGPGGFGGPGGGAPQGGPDNSPEDGRGGPGQFGGPEGGPGGPGGRGPGGPGGGREIEAKLKKVLNANQWARYREIQFQAEGAHAWRRPEVAKELNLTEAQMEKLRNLGGQDGRQDGPPSKEKRAAMNKKAESVLTDSQKAQWEKMKGKPFNLPEPPRPPEGGPEGGPGGGPEGN